MPATSAENLTVLFSPGCGTPPSRFAAAAPATPEGGNLESRVGSPELRLVWDERLGQLIAAISDAEDLSAAAHTAARELQIQTQAARVAIGLRASPHGHTRLIALSDLTRFDPRSAVVRQLEGALDEAAWSQEFILATPEDGEPQAIHPAHYQLSRSLRTSVATVPLRDSDQECWGVVLFIGITVPCELEPLRGSLVRAAQWCAGPLRVWQRCSAGPLARLRRAIRSARTRNRWLGGAGAALLLTGLLCVPVPYRIACTCDVQPVTRRFVVAPFDAALGEILVSPGDRVSAGQLLARLDGREIRCELAAAQADFERAKKERDTALANGQAAAAQMARLEMARLDLTMQLLEQRAEELEIRSPIDGILICGDWQRARGARLTVGQTLFEIGPLDRMIVEVAVPEPDVQFARPGTPVTVQIPSVPGGKWPGTIAKVHPRAEIVEGQNVFIAEVALDNAAQTLLPGMKGTAQVHGPVYSLGWNLFHKPFHAVRQWWGV